MTVLIVLSAWIGLLLAVVGLCVAARRGDTPERGAVGVEGALPGELAHHARPGPRLMARPEGDLGVARRAAA